MRGPTKKDDDAVAKAYLRRITGYEVTEVQEEYKRNEAGELELTRKTEKTKHVPGDPRAAEFWLTNRQPERWKPARLLGAAGESEEGGAPGVVELPPIEEPEPEGEEER